MRIHRVWYLKKRRTVMAVNFRGCRKPQIVGTLRGWGNYGPTVNLENKQMTTKFFAAATTLAAAVGFTNATYAADPLKVGVLATLEGTYTVLGEDGVRGLKTALAEMKEQMGGRDVELFMGPTDASPDSAVRAARKVVEQDGVDIVIGPLSGSEGIAIRDYSKTQPDVTCLLYTSPSPRD